MALALAGCAPREPGSALYSDSELTTPFEDGAILRWHDRDQQRETVYRLRRVQRKYELYGATNIEHMVEFIPINGTAEEDYVVQFFIPSEDVGGFYYGFMWRTANGYDVVRARDERSRSALMRDYRDRVYAQVRAG
jgi:hypothetical protein